MSVTTLGKFGLAFLQSSFPKVRYSKEASQKKYLNRIFVFLLRGSYCLIADHNFINFLP